MLAALLSITVLPACLAILGPTSTRSACGRCSGCRSCATGSRRGSDWLADQAAEDQDPRRGREGFWGKLVNRVMKRPLAFAITDRHRDDPADHPAGQPVARRHQRKVPAAGQRRCARRRRTSTRLFPGFRTEQLTLVIQSNNHGNPSPTSRSPRSATRRCRSPASPTPEQRPARRCGSPCAPTSTAASKDDSVRVIQNGLENRNDAAKKIDELRAITAAARADRVRRRHAGAGAGQHPQPVRQAAADGGAADHHHDDADVPGVRIGGAADQGGGDERADAGLHDGRPDVDLRRRARLRADELHPDSR